MRIKIFFFPFFISTFFEQVNCATYDDIYQCDQISEDTLKHLSDKNDAKDGRGKLLNLSRSLDETCLLSYLLSRKAKFYGMVKEWNSTTPQTILKLADILPNLASTEVHMFHINLLNLEPQEEFQQFYLHGECIFNWKEDGVYGLQWSKHESNLTNVKPLDRRHIWMPDVVGEQSYKKSSIETNYHPVIYNDGFVEMTATFNNDHYCNYDLTKFPFDTHKCCVQFASQKNPGIVNFKDYKYDTWKYVHFEEIRTSSEWKVFGADLEYLEENAYGHHRVAKICIQFSRSSQSLKAETVLPFAASTIITVLVMLLSKWKHLTYGKCFCLLIQFICLFSFMQTRQKLISAGVPMFIQLYQLIIWTTIVSLFVTLILWNLSTRVYKVPPPNTLFLFATFINRWFLFNDLEEKSPAPVSEDATGEQIVVRDHNNWQFIFVMFNNISVVILVFIYCVGIFAIASQ